MTSLETKKLLILLWKNFTLKVSWALHSVLAEAQRWPMLILPSQSLPFFFWFVYTVLLFLVLGLGLPIPNTESTQSEAVAECYIGEKNGSLWNFSVKVKPCLLVICVNWTKYLINSIHINCHLLNQWPLRKTNMIVFFFNSFRGGSLGLWLLK